MAAAPAWARGNIQERADALDRIGDAILQRKAELGTLLSREEGKTLPEGIGEAARAGHIFKFFAGEAVRLTGEQVPSCGPASRWRSRASRSAWSGIITPWNFPLAIPAWKIAPALAYGNCVVFKPADLVPGCAWALAEIISQAGLPPGVFNLVMGRGSVVGEAILSLAGRRRRQLHGLGRDGPRGGAEGRRRAWARSSSRWAARTRWSILDDADLDVAVNCAPQGAYFSTGQRCTASSRLIVTEGIHDRFVAAMVERLKAPEGRRRAAAGHRHRAGRGPDPARPGPPLPRGRPEGGRQAGLGRRDASSATRAGFYLAPALFTESDQRDAHQPRGDLRAGGQRDPGAGLRRGAGGGQRHPVRPLVRHRAPPR